MGKRYRCDYCDKTMVSTPALVRTHNNGLVHQKLVQEHYRQYKDPETILKEEAVKKPCLRFAKGQCQFGAICRFSHYTREELDGLREYVAMKNNANFNQPPPSFQDLYQKLQDDKKESGNDNKDNENTVLYDSSGITHVLPWTYNTMLDEYGKNLPPSIKRIRIEDFYDAQLSMWG